MIVLGIIGLIADMTIPTLVGGYRKQVTVVKLKRFYSTVNQAIRLSEIDNGAVVNWDYPANNSEELEDWYKKYLSKYLVTVKYEQTEDGYLLVNFKDGSSTMVAMAGGLMHWHYYLNTYKQGATLGKNRFIFAFKPTISNGIEPYINLWNKTREGLLNHSMYGCNKTASGGSAFCTKLIQYDGWKISDDYPFKF